MCIRDSPRATNASGYNIPSEVLKVYLECAYWVKDRASSAINGGTPSPLLAENILTKYSTIGCNQPASHARQRDIFKATTVRIFSEIFQTSIASRQTDNADKDAPNATGR